ncbi:hypothetical protein N7474_004511 [Penicillium riverlandense]|uniref:uncharacterized protein n=1 Tax=Penicillium riverlandense TaxID=1903569 RepID=UPI002547AD9D|nr:uncharacterized protein N7474_004511 [Penicillium riverlandense]KAJ5818920.1 hypothetical protein N7474_004511 [Penicillium riverlandense]
MDYYPSYTDLPHIVSMSCASSQAYDAYAPDGSLPADHPFVTRESPIFQLDAVESKPRDDTVPSQTWWKGDATAYAMDYMPPTALNPYHNRFASWNSGLSTVSEPQSPHSTNSGSVPAMSCYTSPPLRHEDVTISALDNEDASYPTPGNLTVPNPRAYEVLPDNHLSPYSEVHSDFDTWSCSHSDRYPTPEQAWASPMQPETVAALPKYSRRSKSRCSSTDRVQKSTAQRRPNSAPGRGRKRRGATSNPNDDNWPRVFICSFASYGCESTFVSKNEWKRHVTSQHLQLGFYRCDVGKCSAHINRTRSGHLHSPSTSSSYRSVTPPPGQPNDFNRKDLFTQHQRRMHAPWLQSGQRRTPSDAERAAFENSLEQVRRRCWQAIRQPPAISNCGFCGQSFSGEGSWDARMEHVGRHFERENPEQRGYEGEDQFVRDWGLHEGILALVNGQIRLASLVRAD